MAMHDDPGQRQEVVGEGRPPDELGLEGDALQGVVHRLDEERPRQQAGEEVEPGSRRSGRRTPTPKTKT